MGAVSAVFIAISVIAAVIIFFVAFSWLAGVIGFGDLGTLLALAIAGLLGYCAYILSLRILAAIAAK